MKHLALLTLALPLMVSGCMMPMMGHGYGGIPLWPIWLLLLAAVIYLVVSRSRRDGGRTPPAPLEILKSRYARGEISREEYERMKKDLENP